MKSQLKFNFLCLSFVTLTLAAVATVSATSHAQLGDALWAGAQIGAAVLTGNGAPDIDSLQYGHGQVGEREVNAKKMADAFNASGTTTKQLISFIRLTGFDKPLVDEITPFQAGNRTNPYFENLCKALGFPTWDHVRHEPDTSRPWVIAEVPFTSDDKLMKYLAVLYHDRGSNVVELLLRQISRLGLPTATGEPEDRLTLLRFLRSHVDLDAGGNRYGYGSRKIVAEFLKLHSGEIAAKERLAVTDRLFDVASDDPVVTILRSSDQDYLARFAREKTLGQIVGDSQLGSGYKNPDHFQDTERDQRSLKFEMNSRFVRLNQRESSLDAMFISPLSAADEAFIMRKLFLNETDVQNGASALSSTQQLLVDYLSLNLVNREPHFVYEVAARALRSSRLAPVSWRNVGGEIYAKILMNLAAAANVSAETYALFYAQFQQSLRVTQDPIALTMVGRGYSEWVYQAINGKMAALLRAASIETTLRVSMILGAHFPSTLDLDGSAFYGMKSKRVPPELPVFHPVAEMDCVGLLTKSIF